MSHPHPLFDAYLNDDEGLADIPTYEFVLEEDIERKHALLRPAGERVIYLDEPSEANAASIIIALVHDCALALNNTQHDVAADVFSLRFRLLSLYILQEDVKEYENVSKRYRTIVDLIQLRRQLSFISDKEDVDDEDEDEDEVKKEIEEKWDTITKHLKFYAILYTITVAPASTGPENDALCGFVQSVQKLFEGSSPASQLDITNLCNEIRTFFHLPAWTPVVPKPATGMTISRELSVYHDIFVAALWMMDYKGAIPYTHGFLSLEDDRRETTYLPEDAYVHHMVLARDVLCCRLAGPSTMRLDGAFNVYMCPMLEYPRIHEQTKLYEMSSTPNKVNVGADFKYDFFWSKLLCRSSEDWGVAERDYGIKFLHNALTEGDLTPPRARECRA